MQLLYFLLYLLVLVGELLAVQDPWPVVCRSQKYWVKPTHSDKCECTSASDSVYYFTTNDAKYRCATINQYAECLSNGICKKNNVTFMLMKEKCITLIFLPGTHTLTNSLYISKRVSLTMTKEPKCDGNVKIYLNEASITLSYIVQLTLRDLSIINNNLVLMNVSRTGAKHSIFKPPSIVNINNLNLSGGALIYECTRCRGKVNLFNIWFNNSYANFTTIDCFNLSIHIYSFYLFLNSSQTGLIFDSLQLKSVLIDSLRTQGTGMTNHAASVYDLLFRSINKSRSVEHLDIMIQNCTLERNHSAGLLIEAIVAQNHQFNFSISNSVISNHKHGGIMIHQPSASTGIMNFTIEGSHIRYNQISMLKYCHHSHYAAGLSVHSETFNTTIVTIKHTEFKGNTDSRNRPVVVYIARAFRVLVESCNFTDNNGTAIQLNNVNDNCASESFNFKGIVNFTGNSGYRGGALSLISSVISIQPNTTLIFENNEATDVGGAIFVDSNIPYSDTTDPDTLVSCFYRFPMWNKDSESCSLTFSNNMATNGGNDIYGASLNCCCTVFTGYRVNETVRSADPSVIKLFNISKNDFRSSISSTPHRVCLTNSDESIVSACLNLTQIFDHDVSVYPGQEFSLEAVLVGYEFGLGTGIINAQLMNHHGAQIWPESSKFQRMEEPKKTSLRYTLYSNTKDTILVLTAENRNEIDQNLNESKDNLHEAINQFYSNSSGIISSDLLTTPVYINVKFKPECPPGFKLRQPPKINTGCDTCKHTQSIYNGCRCLEELDNMMDCLFDSDHEDGYLCLKKPVWVELNDSEMLISNECPLDYCKADLSNVIIAGSNDSSLCDNDRQGKLCGQCAEGYSLMLGSNKCGICSNDYIGLLAVFAVAGILLVILLIVLNVTVAQGTLNGLIFYANIVWAYNEIFFPKDNDNNGFKMFIAWLNLDFGIEVCFFNGLDAYWKTWLQFAFPVYIWIIAGVIILLGRSRYIGRLLRLPSNIVHVLATLVLLSYSKLLRTVIIILVPAIIRVYSNGEENGKDTVWRFDGEIKYGEFPKHCILLSVAILAIVLLWLPYTFILLFINYTRRWSVIAKRKAFFDCYTGPLTPKCQFWVGLLLVVRCFLLISLIFFHPDACVLSMVVIIILIFVLLYNTGSIYNNTADISRYRFCRCVPEFFRQLSLLSMLDISFLLNLVFLGVAVLYADFEEKSKDDIKAKTAVTYTSVVIVMIQFIGIIIYPRFQQYILNRFIVDPDHDPPKPERENQDPPPSQSSIAGIPLLDGEDADYGTI